MKPVSYKQETGHKERICTQEAPQGPAQFQSPPFFLVLLSLEGNRCQTRQGIRFA